MSVSNFGIRIRAAGQNSKIGTLTVPITESDSNHNKGTYQYVKCAIVNCVLYHCYRKNAATKKSNYNKSLRRYGYIPSYIMNV